MFAYQKLCKEYLVILLYCSMAMASGLLAHGELDFALPHSVNLAEAGSGTSDKRIGMVFRLWSCTSLFLTYCPRIFVLRWNNVSEPRVAVDACQYLAEGTYFYGILSLNVFDMVIPTGSRGPFDITDMPCAWYFDSFFDWRCDPCHPIAPSRSFIT